MALRGRVVNSIRGGLGLAGERVARGPLTLITHTPFYAALRTPSRPTFGPGNALHLFEAPTELGRWYDAFDRVVGVLPGVSKRRLAWEVPIGQVVETAVVGGDDHAVTDVWHLNGESESTPLPPDVQMFVVGDDERRLAGARSLYLQGGWGTDVDGFRWRIGQEDAVVQAGRGAIWVGYRFGIPIARVGVFHDAAGLAVIDSLVVHPLYREEGLGTAFAGQAIDGLRAVVGPTTVTATAAPDSPAAKLLARLGFTRSSTITTVTTPR